jgi:heat shock protein HslJ
MDQEFFVKVFLLSFGLCAGLLILPACASISSPQGGGGEITAVVWELSLLNDKELVPATSISVQFTADGKLGGSSGCNHYSGTYTVSGNTLQISSPLASTMMACPPVIMDQESAYLKALVEVKTYSVTGDQLTLYDSKNKGTLVYQAQSQDLSATSWDVIAYNNGKQAVTSVLADSTITANFGVDGTLSGNGGCNKYHGTYTATGKQIKIGPLASTRMACANPAGIMEQEALYLAALQTVSTYKVEGTSLELRTKDGALAVQAVASMPEASTSADSIQEIIWQWSSVTNQTTGEGTIVPNAENYTITFHADGTLDGKADCNQFSGTYSQENGFIITLGTSTMAYCGDASLDQQYLTLLGNVVAGGLDGAGGLALENAGGEQRMLFQNVGPASQ